MGENREGEGRVNISFLSKLKTIQNERLKEFEDLIDKKRKKNAIMRKQFRKRDEILRRVSIKPVLPDIVTDVEVSFKRQFKNESVIDLLKKKKLR